jgi:hypothetical protein
MSRTLPALLLGLALAGCAASPYSRAGGGVGPLHVRAVDWNPGNAPIAGVRAVADAGSDVVAFADGAATVLSGGRVVTVDRSVPRWVSAGTLPAADGSGTWIVGVDGDGRVRRLFGKSSLEPVSDRFGLGSEHVISVASLSGSVAAFRLQGEIAVADGATVTRYATGPLVSLAGGGGRAVLGGDPLRVFDVASRNVSSFAVPELSPAAGGAAFAAVTPAGKLFVATADTVWGEDDHGDLRIRFEAKGMTLHGLVASAERVWFADGPELGVIEGGRVRETSGARVSPAAQISGSPSGDVWTLTGGTLARFAIVDEGGPSWDETVAPAFRRACEACHRVGGEAGVALGTKEAWEKRRERIRKRVLVERTMPPPGRALADADREAIRAWIDR